MKFFHQQIGVLSVLGGLLVLGIVLIGRLPQSLYKHPEYYLPAFGACFAVYCTAVVLVFKHKWDEKPVLWTIIAVALACRLAALVQPPSLSTDIYRYLWDGRINALGMNPYRYPPIAREMRPYRTWYWDTINHKKMVTMYPPLSQSFFLAVNRIAGERVFAYKTAFVLMDLITLGLVFWLLKVAGKPSSLALIYAWHPLVVMEIAGNGHQDALGIMLMTAAVLAAGLELSRKDGGKLSALAGFLVGLSIMAKGYVAAAVPIFARRRPLVFLGFVALAVVPLVGLYWGNGVIMQGLEQYMKNRIRNASLFDWTNQLLQHFTKDHLKLTRMMAAAALLAVVGRMAVKPASGLEDLAGRVMASVGALFLLSHTVYPWYAMWLIPLLCVSFSPGWFLFTGLVSMAYLNPVPHVNPWVMKVEYPPVLLLLAWEAFRKRLKQKTDRR